MRGEDVEPSVSRDVCEHDVAFREARVGVAARRDGGSEFERAVTRSAQDGDAARTTVACCNVEEAVPVQIADGNRVCGTVRNVRNRLGINPIAAIEENPDGIPAARSECHVGEPIAVEIADIADGWRCLFWKPAEP